MRPHKLQLQRPGGDKHCADRSAPNDRRRRPDRRSALPVHNRPAGARIRLHARQQPASHAPVQHPRCRRHQRRASRGSCTSSPRFEGVKEDVTDIILNIKDLVVRSDSDEPVEIFLGGDGPGDITAENIFAPAGRDRQRGPAHRDAEPKGHLEMYLTVERGRGYVTAERNKKPDEPIGVIPIDSIYSPVARVAYRVESTRVEQMTNYDKLDPGRRDRRFVTPAQALSSAGETLKASSTSSPSSRRAAPVARPSCGRGRGRRSRRRRPALPIEDLDLSVRSYNCLKREGVATVGELRAEDRAATCSRSATSARSPSTRSRTS